MTPNELREAYLSFFESHGHTRYPSDSLVPANDPTLLFTSAGMVQFKEMFLGIGNLPFTRAVTAQKCFRTGDLDNVGKTHYHQTFFEMLGNFSFGDYFKKETIQWGWELVTQVFKIPVEKLRVSVYEEDDEAFAIWRDDIGLPESKIWRLGAGDNYWPPNAPTKGPDGPCGPCSEIFYDFGSPGEEGDPEAKRYCEIGNFVFTQFNRVGLNQLEPLKQKNIDVGMGYERLLAVLHGLRSNFQTELFMPLIRKVSAIAGREYSYEAKDGHHFRRIADHVRAGTFLVADGIKPSNEGRGYVMRRVLRRAVRDGIALGIDRPFLHELVPVVVEVMGDAYPETKTAEPAAVAFVRAEEEKFRETFATGMELLERELAALQPGGVLSGKTTFALYDSHGFPADLSEEICRERGIGIDLDEFHVCMEEQRARSRAGSSMTGDRFAATAITTIKRDVAPTEFLGYDATELEDEIAVVIAGEKPVTHIGPNDQDARVIAYRTPFYGESGGQVGDRGWIDGPEGRFLVTDTQRVEGYFVHYGRVEHGQLAAGHKVTYRVDTARRHAITRNHSATHLLHAALRTILGTHVTQAGSLVAPDRLRFDFTHPQGVKADELKSIEDWVNEETLRNAPVVTALMDLEQARASGAMALFGEKYDARVRVVTIGDHSRELCGGIHVATSAEIGSCLLSNESSVASGVRRIEMVTGGGALDVAREQRLALRGLANALKARPVELGERVASMQKELKELRQQAAQSKREDGLAAVATLADGAVEAAGVRVLVASVEGDDAGTLRSMGDELKKKLGECVILLAGRGDNGAALVAAATKGAVAAGVKAGDVLRGLATQLGGKGGGRPEMAQGRAPRIDGLDAALDASRDAVVETLNAG